MNINRDNSSLTILTPLIYFVTLFYSFGVLLMTYFVGFPTFDRIHENVEAAMTIFSHRMIVISTIPMFLNAIFGVMLLKFNDRYFPRIVIWISILLCSVSLISNLLLISSYSDLHTTGFTGEAKSWIIFMSANFQIIPLIIQIFLAFWLLNNHLQDTMWFGRWLFILLFSFTFFALGQTSLRNMLTTRFGQQLVRRTGLNFGTRQYLRHLLEYIYYQPFCHFYLFYQCSGGGLLEFLNC